MSHSRRLLLSFCFLALLLGALGSTPLYPQAPAPQDAFTLKLLPLLTKYCG